MSLGGTWRQPHCRSGPRSVPIGARPATRQKTRHGSKMFAMALHVDHIYVFLCEAGVRSIQKNIWGLKLPQGPSQRHVDLRGRNRPGPVSHLPAENAPFSGRKIFLAAWVAQNCPTMAPNGPKPPQMGSWDR